MRVLVIGDVCEDRFIYADCQRLSPEVPVQVLLPKSHSSNLGMAGNVAANIRLLAPRFEVVTLFPDKPSVKTRYVDKKTNHHFMRVDEDFTSEPLSGADWLRAIKMCPDVVVISDYGKGFLNTQNMEMISKFCVENEVMCTADTKGLLGDWSKNIDLVKINQIEFDNQLKAGIKPWEQCENLIVTRGSDGLDLYSKTGSIIHHEDSHGSEVIDLAGAGDTTLAALTVGWAETGDIKKAMAFAAKAAGVAVSKRGVVAVKREEVT